MEWLTRETGKQVRPFCFMIFRDRSRAIGLADSKSERGEHSRSGFLTLAASPVASLKFSRLLATLPVTSPPPHPKPQAGRGFWRDV
jgi:hypothetical protein